jgi:arylsulfatase A-like enzyme
MTREYRTTFRLWVALLGIMIYAVACSVDPPERPNFVLIMADDLGYGDLGCYGNTRINTPHIDRMAAHGLLFTDYHSNGAVCTPTRAALLTGRYQQRSGLEGVIYVRGETRETGLDTAEFTIAEALRAAGYATGIVGKWHLGYRPAYNPVVQGFDFFRGYVSGNIDYISHYDGAGIPDWWHDTTLVEEQGYVTDLIGRYAVEFIEAHEHEPFFLYMAHEAPHWPYQGRNDRADRLPGIDFPAQGSREDRDVAYKEMVEIMDETVGQVFSCLERLGLHRQTAVIFCSDNGGVPVLGDNGPWRGHKSQLWEGGHRVPALVWWPGKVQPGRYHGPAMSMDWFPTLLRLSGADVQIPVPLDGQDLSEALLHGITLKPHPIYWKYRDQGAVRAGRWKWLMDGDQQYLYDLETDHAESNDLADDAPELADSLRRAFDLWYTDVTPGNFLRTR